MAKTGLIAGVKYTVEDYMLIKKAYGKDFNYLRWAIDEQGYVPEEAFISWYGSPEAENFELHVLGGVTRFRPVVLRGFSKTKITE